MRYKLYLAYTKRSSEKTLGNKRKQNRYQFNYITQIVLYRPRNIEEWYIRQTNIKMFIFLA